MGKYSGLFKQTCNCDQGCGAVAQAIWMTGDGAKKFQVVVPEPEI